MRLAVKFANVFDGIVWKRGVARHRKLCHTPQRPCLIRCAYVQHRFADEDFCFTRAEGDAPTQHHTRPLDEWAS